MRFGSLFAGIGGIDLGLERAGMTCAWQVEKDEFCQRVLAKHWPDVPRFGDIRDVGAHNLEPVDLIAGGFPCQPVSVAGKQAAQDDDRWLWPEFARVLRELRPRYALLENVPGLLTAQQGRAAQEVFGNLAELGFDADWASVPAAAVGAPHLRYRVFIVAHALGARLEERRGVGADAQPQFSPVERDGEALANADSAAWHAARGAGETVLRPSPVERPGRCSCCDGDHWAVEPDVGRVAHGVPARVDRLSALGNAVVPQVAQWVGERLMEVAA